MNAITNKHYEKALASTEEYYQTYASDTDDAYDLCIVNMYRALIYSEQGYDIDPCSEDDALRQKRIDFFEKSIITWDENLKYVDDVETYCNTTLTKANILINYSIERARRLYILAMQSNDLDIRVDAIEGYKECTKRLFSSYEDYKKMPTYLEEADEYSGSEREEYISFIEELMEEQKFTNMESYTNRQLIFIVRDIDHLAGCYDDKDNIRWVFTLDKIPPEIEFPVGHPKANTLYLAHPVKSVMYLPFESAEYNLFIEKIREICYLFQCLGATEISFRSIKGKSISMKTFDSSNLDGGAKVKIINASFDASTSTTSKQDNAAKDEMQLKQTFSPSKKPYCPDDLIWLSTDADLQLLVKQRLEGNLLHYSQRVSSLETSQLSSSQLEDIKSSFSIFTERINCSYSSKSDFDSNAMEEIEWEVSAVFKSIEEFENRDIIENTIASQKLTIAEERYKEEVLFCIEEGGDITDVDRTYLERKRIKLGISSKHASEIEELCMPKLTDYEKEYIEIFKEMQEKGAVTERVRRLLERERQALGITEKRAQEIEKMNE